MEFERVSLADLKYYVERGGVLGNYPGGSRLGDVAALKRYINGKHITERRTGERYRARDVYDVCSYFQSANAARAEDQLLGPAAGRTWP